MESGLPVVLEVAVNGVTSPARNPAVPREPAAIATDALACIAAGAAIIHTHTDEPLLPPDEGGLGATGPDGLPLPSELVYTNTPSDVLHTMETCRRHGLGPNIAVFEPGFLRAPLAYHRAGKLPRGALVKFYFADGEPLFSPPPIREALDLYLAMLGDADGSLLDSPIAALALERGGHLRVGLEDFPDAESNPAEVERAGALCAEHGRRLATIAEAGEILDLPLRA